MTDYEGVSLIIRETLIGASTLITPLIGAWVLLQQNRASQRLAHMTEAVTAVRTDMRELALNTNSIKDALVASTAKASHAEGVQDEKDRQDTLNGKPA